MTAGAPEPTDTNATSDPRRQSVVARTVDNSDNFMSRNDWMFGVGKVAVDDMKIRSADRASLDANSNFAGTGSGIGALFKPQRLADPMKNHRYHDVVLLRL
jgi:hypothetical protein